MISPFPSCSFVSFGNHLYYQKLCKLATEIQYFQLFQRLFLYTDVILQQDSVFWERHRAFIESSPRGYVYWIWKSYILLQVLSQSPDNELILYVDAGCTLNLQGKSRMMEYIQLTMTDPIGILSFQLPFPEKHFTKMDLFSHLNAFDLLDSLQFMATTFFIRKPPQTVAMVQQWYDTCCQYPLLSDIPSQLQNDTHYQEHRHDQSIWSLIRKQHHVTLVIPDETYFDHFETQGKEYPIWATRTKDCHLM